MPRRIKQRIHQRKSRRAPRRTHGAEPVDGPLLEMLAGRWKEFLAQLRHCRAEFTEPSVHDLRVAIRRLVAAVDLLAMLSPPEQFISARVHLKGLLKRMSPLRDTQVQMLAVKKLSQEYPGLAVFSTVLLLREQRNLGRVSRRLVIFPIRNMQQSLFSAARGLERSMRNPSVKMAVRLSLQGSLASAFLRVVELSRRVDASDPTTIHRLRVAFKKFRYATEILRPDLEKAHHKALNDYQTRMGDLHDMEVLMESIEGLRVRTSSRPQPGMSGRPIPAADLARILRRLRRQHSLLVRQFISSLDGLYRFYPPGTGS